MAECHRGGCGWCTMAVLGITAVIAGNGGIVWEMTGMT